MKNNELLLRTEFKLSPDMGAKPKKDMGIAMVVSYIYDTLGRDASIYYDMAFNIFWIVDDPSSFPTKLGSRKIVSRTITRLMITELCRYNKDTVVIELRADESFTISAY